MRDGLLLRIKEILIARGYFNRVGKTDLVVSHTEETIGKGGSGKGSLKEEEAREKIEKSLQIERIHLNKQMQDLKAN